VDVKTVQKRRSRCVAAERHGASFGRLMGSLQEGGMRGSRFRVGAADARDVYWPCGDGGSQCYFVGLRAHSQPISTAGICGVAKARPLIN